MRSCLLDHKNSFLICSLLNNKIFILKDKTSFKYLIKENINFSFIKYLNCNKYSVKLSSYSNYKNRLYNLQALFNLFYTMYKINKKEHVFFKGFFLLIDLVGLGFRIAKITDRIYFFELGWATGVYLFVPLGLNLTVSLKKRKLLIYGYNYEQIYNLLSSFLLLRKMSPYRVGGFMPQKLIIRLRTGKQR